MLDQDRALLMSLVKEYSAVEIIAELVSALRDHRDDLSDMGLKEKAHDYAEAAELLSEIRDVMLDAE